MAIRRARNVADYTKMDDANILTLEYYFKDPEWFDSMNYFEDRRKKKHIELGTESKSLQPKRCGQCSKVI